MMRPPACRSCRMNLVKSFAATFLDVPAIAPLQPRRFLPVARFSHGRPKRANQSLETSPLSSQSVESNQIMPFSKTDAATTSSDPVPWYLQVESPAPPASSHPLADRQTIPDLPEHPPAILPPMLSYLSIDTGLDDLTLLDLRSLNPPPALGANLLMVIGTARSVKHLNVSADRFCRWLRSNYKLRPYADGLLGRNELKLKLRRKARRAKLAASVGNTMYEKGGGADDGITTGWICVTVGQVEDKVVEDAAKREEALAEGGIKAEGLSDRDVQEKALVDDAIREVTLSEAETEKEALVDDATKEEEEDEYVNPEPSPEDQAQANYTGFGSWSNAPRIVVQMFTEEKRAELNLEGLWLDRSTRRTRKAEIATEDAEAAIEEEELVKLESSSMTAKRRAARPRRDVSDG